MMSRCISLAHRRKHPKCNSCPSWKGSASGEGTLSRPAPPQMPFQFSSGLWALKPLKTKIRAYRAGKKSRVGRGPIKDEYKRGKRDRKVKLRGEGR